MNRQQRNVKHQLDEPIRRRWSCWIPPVPGQWKVNTYGGQSSYGFCVRDSKGTLVASGVKWEEAGGCDEEIAEAKALCYGLQKALEIGCKRVAAESACYRLISKLAGTKKNMNLEMEPLLDKIHKLSHLFDGPCPLLYVESRGNSAAYVMSKCSADGGEARWLKNFPKVATDFATWDMECFLNLEVMEPDAAEGDTNIEEAASTTLSSGESSDQLTRPSRGS